MSHASIARHLRRELSPDWNTVGPFQWGKVASVSGGTVDLYLDGATGLTTGVPCLESYSPQVGDVTMVARMQGAAQAARVAIGTLAVEARTSQSGSLASSIAVTAGTVYTPFSGVALGVGTWLVTYGASFLAGAANASLVIWATVSTGTATLSGKWNGEVYVPSGDQSDVSIAFLVTVTAAVTLNLNAEATAAGTIEISNGYVTGGQTGWTAVPVR